MGVPAAGGGVRHVGCPQQEVGSQTLWGALSRRRGAPAPAQTQAGNNRKPKSALRTQLPERGPRSPLPGPHACPQAGQPRALGGQGDLAATVPGPCRPAAHTRSRPDTGGPTATGQTPGAPQPLHPRPPSSLPTPGGPAQPRLSWTEPGSGATRPQGLPAGGRRAGRGTAWCPRLSSKPSPGRAGGQHGSMRTGP